MICCRFALYSAYHLRYTGRSRNIWSQSSPKAFVHLEGVGPCWFFVWLFVPLAKRIPPHFILRHQWMQQARKQQSISIEISKWTNRQIDSLFPPRKSIIICWLMFNRKCNKNNWAKKLLNQSTWLSTPDLQHGQHSRSALAHLTTDSSWPTFPHLYPLHNTP